MTFDTFLLIGRSSLRRLGRRVSVCGVRGFGIRNDSSGNGAGKDLFVSVSVCPPALRILLGGLLGVLGVYLGCCDCSRVIKLERRFEWNPGTPGIVLIKNFHAPVNRAA